ncbi:3-methyl-2-oxobutanoate hydroxymethyltransferase [Methylovulum psychrotolerans]|uniref:3-methyl-2-oxobutanoate hydroxymethyltransferase n=1 Tax=Methylovulum psychrotolerans TaxID=1704499 RepID=A0A1Z4BX69_9GAMM|nr:3-methyl-2-oxobutanoate hydroxymethyltransferase [Methylovulum psychrotolerans]ASF45896.1 3-methyl-2-oxobutanoate hydroxymethyltransferase [Methylovulum psychrotolerans]MBT9097812.1 3-methyl-2-oxobutanoate hydroxymethyltransferase [Methylovulum psychrotolerans]
MTFIVKPLSINDLTAMKQRGEKITCLTAYDASFGALIDRTGIDMMLVGDSLGMTMQGHTTTLPVTIRDMVYHARCVSRARQRAFVVADLPFMSYPCAATAAANAAKLMQAGGVQMVKLEGARLDIVSFLVQQGIPVCGHLGLLPQHINQLGSYAVQGKEPAAADKILADALSLQQAGAALLVLECVPATLAKAIASQLHIPVIGIGAGIDCDGQVLVLQDMLNISGGKRPRFVKDFMQEAGTVAGAILAYHNAVKQGAFPAAEHSF